jgi:hypothetical protein
LCLGKYCKCQYENVEYWNFESLLYKCLGEILLVKMSLRDGVA